MQNNYYESSGYLDTLEKGTWFLYNDDPDKEIYEIEKVDSFEGNIYTKKVRILRSGDYYIEDNKIFRWTDLANMERLHQVIVNNKMIYGSQIEMPTKRYYFE